MPTDSLRTGAARRAALLLVALLAVLATRAGARAGDPALAKFLLEAGRKSVEKKQYDDALSKLEKAAAEDPTLAEARYWIGVAHDRKGDAPKAITAYRTFRDACTTAAAEAPLDKELAKLLKAAEVRLGVLAAAEVELQKLNDAFVARTLAFAKAQFVRDPLIAGRALRLLLLSAPGHEEAKRLLEKLGGAPGAGSGKVDGGPHNDVKKWTDLLATQFLKGSTLVYERDVMVFDDKDGKLYMPKAPYDSTKAYVYEIEFRLLQAHTDTWYFGLVFGQAPQGGQLVTMLGAMDVLLVKELDRVKTELANRPVPPVKPEEWHRLTLCVSGRRVEVFVDDKPLINEEVRSREDLAGSIGLFHQRNRLEVRRWRFGVRE
jgi:tetratricopeptide (TPR) repeat protein